MCLRNNRKSWCENLGFGPHPQIYNFGTLANSADPDQTPRSSDAAERGVWSGCALFAYRIFHLKWNKNESTPNTLKFEMESSNWYDWKSPLGEYRLTAVVSSTWMEDLSQLHNHNNVSQTEGEGSRKSSETWNHKTWTHEQKSTQGPAPSSHIASYIVRWSQC